MTAIHVEQDVTIDWMVGSYSDTWREWRGRIGREPIMFSDTIKVSNILLRNITFTGTHRLRPKTVLELKEIYSKY